MLMRCVVMDEMLAIFPQGRVAFISQYGMSSCSLPIPHALSRVAAPIVSTGTRVPEPHEPCAVSIQ